MLAGRPEMTRRTSDPSVLPKTDDLGRGGEDDVAWWNPRVGKGNREAAAANCV
jgi:hypothetical protein